MVLGGADKPSCPHRKGGPCTLLLDPAFPRNRGPRVTPRAPVGAGYRGEPTCQGRTQAECTPKAGAPLSGSRARGRSGGASSSDPSAIQALLPVGTGSQGGLASAGLRSTMLCRPSCSPNARPTQGFSTPHARREGL